jgi:hypothetical protein
LNPSAIYSKTGKGVQEASGKTSHLSRADRAVLAAFDGRTPVGEIAKKFEKIAPEKFEQLVALLDRDGFIREVASSALGATPVAPPRQDAPAPPSADAGEELDFTQILKVPPRAPEPRRPTVDLAAAARAEAERKAKEKEMLDFRARQEAAARAKAEEAARAKAAAEARARAAAEAKAKAEAEAKIRAAREAAARLAAEARARAEAEAKAKAEAEARARKEAEEKARLEAELKARLEEERRAREEAERKAAEAAERARREAEEQARREAEERARREAEELRRKLDAEMRAKLEEERRAREEAERKAAEAAERARREAEEKARREAEELRLRLEEEHRAREEAERKAREEEERRRREEERRRREEEERRAREEEERRRKDEEERRAREEAERKAAEAAELARREAEEKARREAEELRRRLEEERRAREEAEHKARQEEERRRREEEERRKKEEEERRAREEAEQRRRELERRDREEAERRAREDAERRAAQAEAAPHATGPGERAKPAAQVDDLLADLDAFAQREEEERRAKEEAERKAKEEAARRAREEEERRRREEEERTRREEEERRARQEAERRAREEEERRQREEEERARREEEERKRRAKAAVAAQAAAQPAAAPADGDDIPIRDEDLDLEEVRRDEKVLSEEGRRAAREREQARREREGPAPAAAAAPRRPRKWGKPLAIGAFALLVIAIGAVHVMPLSTAEYESAASEALGVPVKIGGARLSLLTGVQVTFDRVTLGEVSAATARARPSVGSLFGPTKAFDAIELEGVSATQAAFGAALFGKAAGPNFSVARVSAKQVKLEGPLPLPVLDIEAVFGGDGAPQSVTVHGPEKLAARITPRGAEAGVEVSAASLALPFVPALSLSDFNLKGTATRQGLTVSEFDGRAFDGAIAGTARIRWDAAWSAAGELRVRGINAAVFAPALLSEGRVEGRGAFQMSGAAPARLHENARLEGTFKVEKGALGFDIARVLASGQAGGRTEFAELSAQGTYDKGAVQLRNIGLSRGAMSASGALDISSDGTLSGRLTAEIKTPTQALRGAVTLSGKVREPAIRK